MVPMLPIPRPMLIMSRNHQNLFENYSYIYKYTIYFFFALASKFNHQPHPFSLRYAPHITNLFASLRPRSGRVPRRPPLSLEPYIIL